METTTKQLTDGQEKVLAIMPVRSAAHSIMGSSMIISMAFRMRKRRRWTPYTRLLIAMSMCDIVASITISIATFLRPQDTSSRVWAFGNDATCSAVGFMNQISFSAVLYNGMLSIYFLLTARFGFKNEYIASAVEPLMHVISIGYPLLTATAGSTMECMEKPRLLLGAEFQIINAIRMEGTNSFTPHDFGKTYSLHRLASDATDSL
eukprot:scaffold5297_cov104-Cylindrotheca_fusiformis.AAC.7